LEETGSLFGAGFVENIADCQLSASSVSVAVNAARFLYAVTLGRETVDLMTSVPHMKCRFAGQPIPGTEISTLPETVGHVGARIVGYHHCCEIVVNIAGHESGCHIMIHPLHADVHSLHEICPGWLHIRRHLRRSRRREE
jgi:hypothetical protein